MSKYGKSRGAVKCSLVFVRLPRSLRPRQSFQQDLKMETGIKKGGGQKTVSNKIKSTRFI